jgi:hypothetical protein
MIFCCCPTYLHHYHVEYRHPIVTRYGAGSNPNSYDYAHYKYSALFLTTEKKHFDLSNSLSYYSDGESLPHHVDCRISPVYFDLKGLYIGTPYYETLWPFKDNPDISSLSFGLFMSCTYFAFSPRTATDEAHSYSSYDCLHYLSLLAKVDSPYVFVSILGDGILRFFFPDHSYVDLA